MDQSVGSEVLLYSMDAGHHPTRPYDSPWKAAISHALRAFTAFFFAEIYAQIDWSKRPRFRDKELAGLAVGDELVADKLVEVYLRAGGVHWVLIHIEVQAQRDASLARRVLDYNYRIFKEYGRPVASLVVLADGDAGWRPHDFHTQLLGTEMGISFPIAKLLDQVGNSEALLRSNNPFALLTLAHLRTQQARRNPAKLFSVKWQYTKLLFQHRWSKQRIIIMFKVLNWMMVLPGAEQRRYWRAVNRMQKEMKMEWIDPIGLEILDKAIEKATKKASRQALQQGIQKGIQQGIKRGVEQGLAKGLAQGGERGRALGVEQGLEQGRKEGATALLERQLTRRFGPLPKTARNKLLKASLTQLEAWSDTFPEAQSLKQVMR